EPVAYPLGPTSKSTEIACSNGFCSFFENSNSSDNVYRSCCLSVRFELLLSAKDTGASRRRAAIQVRLQSLLFIVTSVQVLLMCYLETDPLMGNEQDDLCRAWGCDKEKLSAVNASRNYPGTRPEHFMALLADKQ